MPVLAVDKPLGLTSHDVVARARRLLGTRKVGHAGTLDPLATGVLLVLVDEATKLSAYLTGHDKSYLAWVALGATTPTLDAEGPVLERGDASGVSEARLSGALAGFLQVVEQRPPAFSAVKRAGRRSYAAARAGRVEEPPPRPVAYRSVELLAFAPSRAELPVSFAPRTDTDGGSTALQAGTSPRAGAPWHPRRGGRTVTLPDRLDSDDAPFPTALVAVTVAAGTYVRAMARDLGVALGCPAHLSGLVRVRSGAVDLADTCPLEALADATPLDPARVLGLPTLTLEPPQASDVRHGKRPTLPVTARTALLDQGGALVALAEPTEAGAEDGAGYRLLRVFG